MSDEVLNILTKKINDKKVKVIFDDGFYLPIYKSEYYKYFKNDSIDRHKFDEFHKTIINRGKKRVYYLLGEREYTTYELRTKLKRGYYHPDDIGVILTYFIDLGYLDDHAFAKKYVDYYKDKKSLRQIKEKLSQKGISRDIIQDVFTTSDTLDNIDELQYDLAYEIAVKKYRLLSAKNDLNTDDRYLINSIRQKLYNHLISKGYNYAIISRVLSEIIDY